MSTGGSNSPVAIVPKLLASHCMLKAHQKGCIQGSKFIFEDCGQEYATKQGLRQHTRVTHGPEQPAPDEVLHLSFLCKAIWGQKVNEGAYHYL